MDEQTMTHAEALGDPDDCEYQGRTVFRIDDGERYWYVANNPGEALVAHIRLMDPDYDAEFTVSRVEHHDAVSVTLETRDDAKDYPAHFQFVEGDPDENRPHRIRAYAGMWAAHLKAGEMICSSAF